MCGEIRYLTIAYTTMDSDPLPMKPDGKPRYADDVADEIRQVVTDAVMAWYHRRGHVYLKCEPMV